jgi:V/A-type H+-transporting ATPase subunit C
MADDTRYAYAVARVRGMETRVLDRQWIERLLSETPAGVLKALGDSAYQEALAGVARPEDVEQGLEKALADTLGTIARLAPEPELIDLFRLRWDFRNLKSLIKASVLKRADRGLGLAPGLGTVDVEVLRKAVEERNFMALPAVLADAARAALDAHRDASELAAIDRICDAALWAHSLAVARSRGNEFLTVYLRTEIDLANVRTFVRMKEAGKDATDLAQALLAGGTLDAAFFRGLLGEPTDAFARALEFGPYADLAPVFSEWSPEKAYALERACDNVLLKRVEPAKMVAYGIEPLIAYILRRQIEIKLVRTAVLAKLDGLARGDVEERLRTIHV